MEFDPSVLANNTPLLVLVMFIAYELRIWRTKVIPGFTQALNAFSASIDKLAPGTSVLVKRAPTSPVGVPVVLPPESSGGGS